MRIKIITRRCGRARRSHAGSTRPATVRRLCASDSSARSAATVLRGVPDWCHGGVPAGPDHFGLKSINFRKSINSRRHFRREGPILRLSTGVTHCHATGVTSPILQFFLNFSCFSLFLLKKKTFSLQSYTGCPHKTIQKRDNRSKMCEIKKAPRAPDTFFRWCWYPH